MASVAIDLQVATCLLTTDIMPRIPARCCVPAYRPDLWVEERFIGKAPCAQRVARAMAFRHRLWRCVVAALPTSHCRQDSLDARGTPPLGPNSLPQASSMAIMERQTVSGSEAWRNAAATPAAKIRVAPPRLAGPAPPRRLGAGQATSSPARRRRRHARRTARRTVGAERRADKTGWLNMRFRLVVKNDRLRPLAAARKI